MLGASYGPNLNIASNGSWSFHLIVDVGGEKCQYTPKSDISLFINDLCHLLLEVASDEPHEWDRCRMLLQAACLARLGYALRQGSTDPFIVSAIYIDHNLYAEWYLLYQPGASHVNVGLTLQEAVHYLRLRQVEYVIEQIDLEHAKATFESVFRLYNFVSLANEDNTLRQPLLNVGKLRSDVKQMKLPLLTTGHGADEPVESDILSDVAILEALERTGYTIPPEVEGFGSLLPVHVSLP